MYEQHFINETTNQQQVLCKLSEDSFDDINFENIGNCSCISKDIVIHKTAIIFQIFC